MELSEAGCAFPAGDLAAKGDVELDFPTRRGLGDVLGISETVPVVDGAADVTAVGVFSRWSLLERCGETTKGCGF